MTDLHVKPEKLSPLGYGMAGCWIALCFCSSVVGILGSVFVAGYGGPWAGTVMLAVGLGSAVATVALARIVARSRRSK